MATAPNFDDYFIEGKAEAIDRRPELTFDEGDISEFLVAAAAAMADNLTGYATNRVKATFVDGAVGDDLTVLADDRYNIQRNEAQKATGVVAFTRATAVSSGTIPAGFTVATEKDYQGKEIRYVTTVPLSFAISEFGPKSVNAEAEIAGSDGNADADTIVRVIDAAFDTFTVTNPDAFVGGTEEETDEDLRERIRNFPIAVRRGTKAALEYGALTVPTVKRATAVEVDGYVNLYISDIDGGSSPTMVDDVTVEIENWRAAGIVVNVYGGELYTLTGIDISLSVRTGVDIGALTANIKSAIVARIKKLKIGESCSPDLIKQAAMNVDPDNILAVTVNSPNATVVPSANQLIRTDTSEITVS